MSIANELRAAIAANAAETKRIAEAFAKLQADEVIEDAEAAAEHERLTAEAAALKAEKDALAEKIAQAEVEKQATAAELAELKGMVESDTADEAKIGAATSGGSTGGIVD